MRSSLHSTMISLFSASATVALASSLVAFPQIVAATCKTDSQPNPIAAQYPDLPTGTINGTVAILPIPYALARKIVPDEYAILKDAYQSLLPDFPKDLYPAMLQSQLDHDIQQGIIHIPDFGRSSISFPFVDRLGDGYTAMTYGDKIMISALNPIALLGVEAYGYSAVPAYFHPACNAYESLDDSDGDTKHFAAYRSLHPFSGPVVDQNFTATHDKSPFPIDFFKNVTNQPQFSNNKLVCDHYVRLYNSSVTLPPYAPTVVRGTVKALPPVFPVAQTWVNVWGLQMDNAFVEYNYVSCDSLKGYTFSD